MEYICLFSLAWFALSILGMVVAGIATHARSKRTPLPRYVRPNLRVL